MAYLLYKGIAASGLISSAGMVPPACRYVPTCSSYSREAVEKYGFLRGIGLSIKRVLRCCPWSAGGWDPVPIEIAHKLKI